MVQRAEHLRRSALPSATTPLARGGAHLGRRTRHQEGSVLTTQGWWVNRRLGRRMTGRMPQRGAKQA